jgi:probable rRNA maturation factor
MPSYEVEIQVEPAFAGRVVEGKLAQIVYTVLEQEQQPEGTELTLVITDDEQIRALNRSYREIDSATDVLSFPSSEGPAFVTPEGLPPYLGDVIVSFPTALAQATEQAHSVDEELALLIVHGCLHLLGYDHATDEEQQRMWARQDTILQLLQR